ncbi:methylenetetrahydrofolate--tRNA-(uracil(54)-C(5))-methyltransferase (FADH(2)-oxidizing) TrmFO [Aminithiophilus ramosus]|uniref:Methylenetetrahydrofolate--tRNA-(uracil-5-)-methyltransferase TrmFO n=1 Tax=Aminithiophilus ramosus TaxID=3029084 RepID=A0A9Q7ALJ9_9BACT|nr:methylenetetrahydrofolate--tRNA-(uracil(54)-C(5))-methyltransferase (FADH(2)-oxidizing) TrmFO [Aminithiophilus ramosus]QTX31678.1 methylenetetrahydrofolate--tRNA-(uracil(54)-C(5))-methyltransferase (FADH(2)-oxidizing) TrmFO [Aminithiophilus ramosus]
MAARPEILVVGAGLAGSEAAWQLASRGYPVRLVEMRPRRMTAAHVTGHCAELVCSNSLGADALTSAGGILKAEMRRLGSLILSVADERRVPAGQALAVDREGFARAVTDRLASHPLIRMECDEIVELPRGPAIVATGPLTSGRLAEALKERAGGFLAFFDAVAPVVTVDSVDFSVAFRAGRYGRGDDYVNCPMDEEQYRAFHKALVEAEGAPRKDFERDMSYFEGCLPVEIIASRGPETLRFGPLKPVGLVDASRPDREFFAVVQLRQDNGEGTLFNLVGFQTNLRWGEQERVFRMIPGLERAEFVRFGVMHRNVYLCAPRVLDGALRLKGEEDLFLAGQIVGVEGYMESTAMGLVAALNVAARCEGRPFPLWPRETAIGSLLHYLVDALPATFQPMNVNLGIFPPLERKVRPKPERCRQVALRALEALGKGVRKEDLPENLR